MCISSQDWFFCVMKRKIKYAPATVESTNQPSMNYCNAIGTRRSFTHTHTVFSFEWILFSRRFDLLTIKQIESTNQAINSYKQHNKLKHWHYVSNGLVKCLCGGRGTNWRKIFWYDLAGFFLSSSFLWVVLSLFPIWIFALSLTLWLYLVANECLFIAEHTQSV